MNDPRLAAQSTDQPPLAAFHALSAREAAGRLQVTLEGLTTTEAQDRLQRFGRNELAKAPPTSRFVTFVGQFRSAVVVLLIAAAVVSGALGEWIDTLAILAIVLLNGVLGFLQEDKARRALDALEKLASPLAHVVRDGVLENVPARHVVPGDRIRIEAGDLIPADARLIDAARLTVQEASLTGESTPLDKDALVDLPEKTPLAERYNMLYLGTTAAAGKADALVVATGMQTELGRIAGMLEREEHEPTPLERRLNELGKVLMVVCLATVAIIFALQVARGGEWLEVFLLSVSLAVAAVPEGLPAVVTLALALGLERMVRRNALVRKLPSVETLGSVTAICSDKTGTLTRNEMTVREIVTGVARYQVTGVGFAPEGDFLRGRDGADSNSIQVADEPGLVAVLVTGARCTTAQLRPPDAENSQWTVVGDPTEGALLVAARKAKIDHALAAEQVVHEIPFDSDRKAMSIVVAEPGRRRMMTKGAPEVILGMATAELVDGQPRSLDDARRRALLDVAQEMAGRALRVLALAQRDFAADHQGTYEERDLVLVGMLGMIDPPRDEARGAVELCRTAGIRPIMITGDHPATAAAIGKELGIGGEQVVTGAELDAMNEEQLITTAQMCSVYARVTAEHKQRIVRALRAKGAVVAMTGDGVNDAPAVAAADIGIAMGITGTDVTKAAADMVLTDDNFASIVGAVEEGRAIFDNIQRVVLFLLSCNAGEVMLMFFAALAGWPTPLLPIQLLWINLITDGLPALTLGMERPDRNIMSRPPRPPREPVVSRARGGKILAYGALFALSMGLGFGWLRWQENTSLEEARTVAFCVACFGQMLFAFGCRSDSLTFPQIGLFTNRPMLLAIALSAGLQLTTILIAPLRSIFGTVPLSLEHWLLVVALSIVPVTALEVIKLVRSALSKDQTQA